MADSVNGDQSSFPFGTKTAREKFLRFHENNPAVYAEFIRRARKAKARGFTYLSARDIWGVMRWTSAFSGDPQETYKLNNNYSPFYSRLAMAQEPDLAGFFRTRKQTVA
jgi:hypothetical protein